jgi:glyoxylase-like metal-dependent hydrolase (beta-lactamase superfamily II)
MKQLYPDLWQTHSEHPFEGVNTHAYFLMRDQGNVLFYSTGQKKDLKHIWEMGGIECQLLSHRDEAGPPLEKIKNLYGSKLACHELEKPFITEYCPVEVLFRKRQNYLDGIEVIPTPGHTDGSVCFYFQSPFGKNYLFTGDTIFPKNDGWGTYVMPAAGGSVPALKASLKLLRLLQPDVVISSASVGHYALKEMSTSEWQDIVDQTLLSLS